MDKRRDKMVEKIEDILWEALIPYECQEHDMINKLATSLVDNKDNPVRTADGFEVDYKTTAKEPDEAGLHKFEIKPINYSEVDNEG